MLNGQLIMSDTNSSVSSSPELPAPDAADLSGATATVFAIPNPERLALLGTGYGELACLLWKNRAGHWVDVCLPNIANDCSLFAQHVMLLI